MTMQRARTWTVVGSLSALVLSASVIMLRRKLVAVTVYGRSMEPTYHEGDRVLVRRNSPLRRGRVVVAEHPSFAVAWHDAPMPAVATATGVSGRPWVIKRVAAVPGDPIPRDRVVALADVSECYVPPGMVVLLGDNPKASHDSRQLGYFPVDRILGAVVRRMSL